MLVCSTFYEQKRGERHTSSVGDDPRRRPAAGVHAHGGTPFFIHSWSDARCLPYLPSTRADAAISPRCFSSADTAGGNQAAAPCSPRYRLPPPTVLVQRAPQKGRGPPSIASILAPGLAGRRRRGFYRRSGRRRRHLAVSIVDVPAFGGGLE